ncbi:MAG TPA: polysaccharide deacetylase family protein [Acidimicrobiales bacterium]|nr:polysaccharide deacetylase family protein [Acidimicrobiales bacterium]
MRTALKRQLARAGGSSPAAGASLLIYHRVGGGSPDERDLSVVDFEAQLDALAGADVVPVDTALDRLDAGDGRPSVVLTFDDGFADVFHNAWPLLRERALPFTLYVAAGYVGGTMQWEGSTARQPGAAIGWDELAELSASGLCTVGNHTFTHARPHLLTTDELDRCTAALFDRIGTRPRHFAYTWGVDVPDMHAALRERFRSAATGHLGRNGPGCDRMALRRIPVRRSDPIEFFRAKLAGRLLPERAYGAAVTMAKRLGARG